jgi:HSP20 family protein
MAQFPVSRRNDGGGMMARRESVMDMFRQEIGSLFDRFFRGWMSPFGQEREWGFDMEEADKEIVIRADMPGFEQNEMDVRLENDVLTIKAEKEEKGDGQRSHRSFYRSVTLPSGIDADKAQATYRNGVLELRFPKPEGARGKRIQIQSKEASSPAGSSATATTGGAQILPASKS